MLGGSLQGVPGAGIVAIVYGERAVAGASERADGVCGILNTPGQLLGRAHDLTGAVPHIGFALRGMHILHRQHALEIRGEPAALDAGHQVRLGA